MSWHMRRFFSRFFAKYVFMFLLRVHHKYQVSNYDSQVSLSANINKSNWHRLCVTELEKVSTHKLERENQSQKVRLPFKWKTRTMNYVFLSPSRVSSDARNFGVMPIARFRSRLLIKHSSNKYCDETNFVKGDTLSRFMAELQKQSPPGFLKRIEEFYVKQIETIPDALSAPNQI